MLSIKLDLKEPQEVLLCTNACHTFSHSLICGIECAHTTRKEWLIPQVLLHLRSSPPRGSLALRGNTSKCFQGIDYLGCKILIKNVRLPLMTKARLFSTTQSSASHSVCGGLHLAAEILSIRVVSPQ